MGARGPGEEVGREVGREGEIKGDEGGEWMCGGKVGRRVCMWAGRRGGGERMVVVEQDPPLTFAFVTYY